jgi:hypothetical protein
MSEEIEQQEDAHTELDADAIVDALASDDHGHHDDEEDFTLLGTKIPPEEEEEDIFGYELEDLDTNLDFDPRDNW